MKENIKEWSERYKLVSGCRCRSSDSASGITSALSNNFIAFSLSYLEYGTTALAFMQMSDICRIFFVDYFFYLLLHIYLLFAMLLCYVLPMGCVLKKSELNWIDWSHSYLFEAAHEIVANWRSRQVCSAGAPTHVEEIVGAQHGVVFLGVASGGEDPINGDSHLLRGNT